jgi:phage terminase large subunit-like protein
MQTWPAPPRGAFHGRRVRVVIGVDPPSGGGTCGIVVCALDRDGVGHVLADHSVSAASPERWARAVADAAALYHREDSDAPLIVAEVNQGGRMVESVLRAAGPGLRIKLVRAKEARQRGPSRWRCCSKREGCGCTGGWRRSKRSCAG